MPSSLKAALVSASPRLSPRAVPLAGTLIYLAVILLWFGLFARSFGADGLLAWSAGIVYILYDVFLMVVVARLTWPAIEASWTSWKTGAAISPPKELNARPSLGIVIAAYNEVTLLPETLAALCSQTDLPDQIIIVDDGSTDGTAASICLQFELPLAQENTVSAPSAIYPFLRMLRRQRSGKAEALNAGISEIETEIVVTIDADTALAPDALAAIRRAFAAEPSIVAAGGLLVPVCDRTPMGRMLQWFQTYEYIRNMVGRFAWMRAESLVLISGAFAAFRRNALIEVGGFDSDCLVEDYELTHRLHRYSIEHGLGWRLRMVGGARAVTHAPGTLGTFLTQRRRWFAGFLQTHYWNRDITGNRRFDRLGTMMMPIKAIDTLQPIYGLTAFILLTTFLLTGRSGIVVPAFGFITAKILVDFAFNVWIVYLYRDFTGDRTTSHFGHAIMAAAIEPFSFQLLRHVGAAWGWLSFLTGRQHWGQKSRSGLRAGSPIRTSN